MITQRVLIYSLKTKDRYNKELLELLDEDPVVCYSMANNFIGLAVKEKGIRYFFPKGCKIMIYKGELICFVHEYNLADNAIS